MSIIVKIVVTLVAVSLMVLGASATYSGGNYALRMPQEQQALILVTVVMYSITLVIIGWELRKRIWR